MIRFKEFLARRDAEAGTLIQEAVLGGSPKAQLAAARVSFKQNDGQLRKAWQELAAKPDGDDLEHEVARLKDALRALVVSELHNSRELHLAVQLLVLAYDNDQQRTRRR